MKLNEPEILTYDIETNNTEADTERNNELHEKFDTFLKHNLNKPQYESVTQKDGALLVIAGAGSGKTRVITSRIINLILNENVPPQSIVALTFTNKAANEMKERILSFLGSNYKLPFVGTFHSYCLLLLRSNPTLLPFAQFSILDADDQLSLIKKIVKANNLEKRVKASQLVYQISNLKNQLHCEIATEKTNQNTIDPILKEVYHAYESEKTASCSFDFDDLILSVLQLFKKSDQFKNTFQNKIRHVLVDEYQDTSHAQHALLKEMGLTRDNKFNLDSLCAVGDEDQSIYSWRGASVANMLKFQQDFTPVTKVKIEQNYRSVQPILQAANCVIEQNKFRNPKSLWSDRKAKNRILLLSCRSGEQEADAIVKLIQNLPKDTKLSNVAILYRTHFQSRIIEESCIYHSIPYHIVGGIRFYERKEIKDVLAYLRLVANPFDKISLLRVINIPARGLGQKFEQLLLDEWQKNPFFDFKQLLHYICESPDITLTPLKRASVLAFLEIFESITENLTLSKIVDIILDKTNYLNYLRTAYDPKEADAKIENVQEFTQSIFTFEHSFKNKTNNILPPDDPFYVSSDKPTLENFLHEVSLMQEKSNRDNKEEQVQMMSLHAAKGLEFDIVIIAGLEEGLLPSARSLYDTEKLEEERRLFYVGITRAREYLLLSHAVFRNKYGVVSNQVTSRFVDEIDRKYFQDHDIEHYHASDISTLFCQWFGIQKEKALGDIITFGPAKKTQKFSHPSTNKQPNIRRKASFARNPRSTRPKHIAQHESLANTGSWQRNQQVQHKKFGLGVITKIEQAPDNEFYITVIFSVGKKKILSSFLEKA